jgi:hypothetical protein
MTEIQILFQLQKFYGDKMTLNQALEATGQIVFIMETLNEEGNEYDETELIKDIGEEAMEIEEIE